MYFKATESLQRAFEKKIYCETELEHDHGNEEMLDGELELPRSSQVSGTKELKDDPPEDEANSKKSRTADLTNPILNESYD